jgi:hypothetical protein
MANTVEVIKPKRKPTEYNLFVGECRRKGMTMSDAASAWNRKKGYPLKPWELEKMEKLQKVEDEKRVKASKVIQRCWRLFLMCRTKQTKPAAPEDTDSESDEESEDTDSESDEESEATDSDTESLTDEMIDLI